MEQRYRDDGVGNRVVAKDSIRSSGRPGRRAAYAVDVVRSVNIEYPASHVVHLIVRISG